MATGIDKSLAYLESLHEEPFFHGFDRELIDEVRRVVYHREYTPRQIICFPDDSCDYAYWVRQGRVKITRVDGDNRELAFRHLVKGDLFGEECLVKAPKCNAYAEAVEPAMLCLMAAADFRRLAEERGLFSLAVARHACRRSMEAEDTLAGVVFHSVRRRVASVLLHLYRRTPQEDRQETTLHITHQDIAALAGTTRETTTVVLHELTKEGAIERANRRLRLRDPVALEQVARKG